MTGNNLGFAALTEEQIRNNIHIFSIFRDWMLGVFFTLVCIIIFGSIDNMIMQYLALTTVGLTIVTIRSISRIVSLISEITIADRLQQV